MKYRPKIGAGDFDTKTKKVEKFLAEGHKVKVTIMFRGREMQHPELGRKILDHVAEDVVDQGRVEIYPRLDGRNMTMVLAPDKKAQAAAEKRRQAEPKPVPKALTSSQTPPTPARRTPRRPARPTPAPRAPPTPGPTSPPRCRPKLPPASPRPETHHPARSPPAGRNGDTRMPKMKTHRGAAKRFKITGSGKITRRKANLNHILEKKSPARKRRLTGDIELAPGDAKRARGSSACRD